MEFAKQYYGCDDIQGVYLENEGGSGTARLDGFFYDCHAEQEYINFLFVSSHWEKRTLHHELMNGYISA